MSFYKDKINVVDWTDMRGTPQGAALSVVIYFMGTPGEHSLPARQLADPDPVCVPIPLHLINSSCSLAAAGFLNDSVQGLTWNP